MITLILIILFLENLVLLKIIKAELDIINEIVTANNRGIVKPIIK